MERSMDDIDLDDDNYAEEVQNDLFQQQIESNSLQMEATPAI